MYIIIKETDMNIYPSAWKEMGTFTFCMESDRLEHVHFCLEGDGGEGGGEFTCLQGKKQEYLHGNRQRETPTCLHRKRQEHVHVYRERDRQEHLDGKRRRETCACDHKMR